MNYDCVQTCNFNQPTDPHVGLMLICSTHRLTVLIYLFALMLTGKSSARNIPGYTYKLCFFRLLVNTD